MNVPKLITVGVNFALVDEEDFDTVNQYKWHINNRSYAHNSIVGMMHRFLMHPSENEVVDHINHNPLDNRKCNLRVCSQSLNMGNSRKQLTAKPDRITTSQYKGVSWRSDRQRWAAYVGTAGKNRVALGCYATEEEAALAYNAGAIKMFGEFAKLNVIV